MGGLTVLVVDDDQLLRILLRSELEQAGFNVLEAGTGKEALELCKPGVDLVLLDIKLPDTDGLDLLRELKAAHPECAVIMMTSHTTPEGSVRAKTGGAYHYAAKPFDINEMLKTVRGAIPGARRPRRAAGTPGGSSSVTR